MKKITIKYKKADEEIYRVWGWANDEAEATQVITWLYQDKYDAYWE